MGVMALKCPVAANHGKLQKVNFLQTTLLRRQRFSFYRIFGTVAAGSVISTEKADLGLL